MHANSPRCTALVGAPCSCPPGVSGASPVAYSVSMPTRMPNITHRPFVISFFRVQPSFLQVAKGAGHPISPAPHCFPQNTPSAAAAPQRAACASSTQHRQPFPTHPGQQKTTPPRTSPRQPSSPACATGSTSASPWPADAGTPGSRPCAQQRGTGISCGCCQQRQDRSKACHTFPGRSAECTVRHITHLMTPPTCYKIPHCRAGRADSHRGHRCRCRHRRGARRGRGRRRWRRLRLRRGLGRRRARGRLWLLEDGVARGARHHRAPPGSRPLLQQQGMCRRRALARRAAPCCSVEACSLAVWLGWLSG